MGRLAGQMDSPVLGFHSALGQYSIADGSGGVTRLGIREVFVNKDPYQKEAMDESLCR